MSTVVSGWSCPKCGAIRRSEDDICHGVRPVSRDQADRIIAERRKQAGTSGTHRWS